MHQYREMPIDKLPKVQKMVYETIKDCHRLTLSEIASMIKKEKRSLSSALAALQEKELIVLNDHYFTVTGNQLFKTKLLKPQLDSAEAVRHADPEHDEWLRDVLKQKEQKLLRSQVAQYL